jgi:hypothetical protein
VFQIVFLSSLSLSTKLVAVLRPFAIEPEMNPVSPLLSLPIDTCADLFRVRHNAWLTAFFRRNIVKLLQAGFRPAGAALGIRSRRWVLWAFQRLRCLYG